MKSRALLVARARGEATRRLLRDAGLLRDDVPIRREGDRLAFPIADDAVVPAGLGELAELEFEPGAAPGPADYRDVLGVSPAEKARMPRSFDVIGDIVLVRIPDEMDAHTEAIGAALLEFVPGARIVGRDRGVHGDDRRRSIERIAGTGGWRTRHRENGIGIEVDLERAYFSPRLAREHARVADEVAADERVYDLCCGVGPFALTIASRGRATAIVAVDANPDAIALLEASRSRVAHGDRIRPTRADVAVFAPGSSPVERVILNLPREGIKYLPSVARTVAPRGRLYYYEVTPRAGLERRGEEIVRVLGGPLAWLAGKPHVVHPYSPTADLVGFTFDRTTRE